MGRVLLLVFPVLQLPQFWSRVWWVIWEPTVPSRVATEDMTVCGTMSGELDSRGQMESLIKYQPSCYPVTSLLELLDSVPWLPGQFQEEWYGAAHFSEPRELASTGFSGPF